MQSIFLLPKNAKEWIDEYMQNKNPLSSSNDEAQRKEEEERKI